MEVTRKNFKEALPFITSSIDKADFLVIDAEFTGLRNGREVSIFDSPQEYYTTLLTGSTDFSLIQYGLSAFCWNDDKKQYTNESYNFYLFPRGRSEKLFLCQSSSLNFLAAQGFDFNKLIKEGISYMTEPVETRLRENLTEQHNKIINDKESIPIPEEHKNQIEDICKSVHKFLHEEETEEMEIDKCNAFVRRLLFQELGMRFKNKAYVETKVLENKNRVLKVTKLKSVYNIKDLESQKKEKEWEEFEEAVGFSKVARMISQSEKLVIGHNMVLDVLHTLTHFFQPLPADYGSFKEFAHCMFPRLLDTKYMSSLPPFKDKVNSSVLHHLLATLSEAPFSLPNADSEEGRGYRRTDDKHHEAGYDAYVTGLCFLAMHAHAQGSPGRVGAADCAPLAPYVNRLFLARTAHQDSPCMNLAGADPTPSRDHVFHLTFPKEWQRNNINQLFSAYGQITVQFLDDTSALVALSRRDLAKTLARAFEGAKDVSLVPYVKYKAATSMSTNPLKSSEKFVKLPCVTSAIVHRGAVKNTGVARSPHMSWIRPSDSASSAAPARAPPASPSPKPSPAPSLSPSLSPVPASVRLTRKRTSSGVLQIEECVPLPKKSDVAKENTKDLNNSSAIFNGRRKHSESEKQKKGETKKEKGLVIERFESDQPVQSVTAFKESDSWD